ncbi:aminotransferase-like domain-containing protein [Roseateles oligotrophus]|uniref:PLP-dependent aminotransferase family protein n=1 Tax=Roseateles oligotrophus TaxID=1769250 RepID=A0ABT2YGA8_9BURK|nr:PLP-dependent aminotransferase family protein [Roseateles oligotrophus]MCV2369069.1 PLP-dependent aminotransferase family protein [Roseateles oligotrophus]
MDYLLLLNSFSSAKSSLDSPNSGWSGQRKLHECLRQAIRSGTLAPGSRLLASRALATELGVARNTVLYAYEQLATEGLVNSDRRGTTVSLLHPARALTLPTRSMRQGLSRRAAGLACLPVAADLAAGFAPGVPALPEFPLSIWRRLSEKAWRSLGSAQLNYGAPAGEPALRSAIADHLRASRGVRCESSQVFITDGTQASLDLCARAFADPGDKVWIESPGYGGALTAFRGAQLNVIGIPVDEEGMAAQAGDWRRHPPRLIYVTPSHQYPSGGVLSLERRLALIAQARVAGALIIEDDYDSEFRYDGPPLAAMQGQACDLFDADPGCAVGVDGTVEAEPADAPVLYLGTFSKSLFPGLRIGFLVVPQALAEPLRALLARSAPRGRAADQLALAEFMRNGQFGLHLRRMRRLYRQRRDALIAALQLHMADLASIHGTSAGMHLALRFHSDRLDDMQISAAAMNAGIVAPALSQHQIGRRKPGWSGLMLGYAQVPVEKIGPLVQRLAAIIRGQCHSL